MRKTHIAPEPTWQHLAPALEELEQAAIEAVVPGELRSWSEALGVAVEPVLARFRDFRKDERARFEEMSREDPTLEPRIQALREDLATLRDELHALASRTARLSRGQAALGSGSVEPTARGEELRERTLTWLTKVRAYHGRSDSWFVESIYRDRGVQD